MPTRSPMPTRTVSQAAQANNANGPTIIISHTKSYIYFRFPIQSLIILTKLKIFQISEIKFTYLEFTLYLCVVCILSAIGGLIWGENREGKSRGRREEVEEEKRERLTTWPLRADDHSTNRSLHTKENPESS